MNNKTQLHLMVSILMAIHPAFMDTAYPHHQKLLMLIKQLHQRSHQGIPQWIMDETHGSYQPPWFLSKSNPNPAFQPALGAVASFRFTLLASMNRVYSLFTCPELCHRE